MRFICAIMLALSAGTLIVGCSSNETVSGNNSSFAEVSKAASACTDSVHERSKGLDGKTILTSKYWVEGKYVQMHEGMKSHKNIKAIPYFESTALDNGNPGSAWNSCMTQKGIKV